MTDTAYDTALAAALSGEYAAIYAYGVLGAHLTGSGRSLALQSELAHRDLRDSLLDTLAQPPEPEAVYGMPFAVTSQATAIAAAVDVEVKCAALWRAAVAAASPDQRKMPLAKLTDAALRAAAFRRAGGARPGTVAFPGQ